MSQDRQTGLNPTDLIDLPDDQRGLIQHLIRRGQASAAELSLELNRSQDIIEAILQGLASKGYLAQVPGSDPPSYKAVMQRKRVRPIASSLWDKL